MSALLRNSGVLLLALGLAACQPPEPPVLAPAAKATTQPAQQAAANDDLDPMARAPIVDPPSTEDMDSDGAPAVVSVALDHAGEVLIGQPFSELQAEAQWHSAGLAEATAGRCDYYERGTLPEGVAMLVQDGNVVRFDLAPIDDSGLVVTQPGPFGLRLDMPRAQVLQQMPQGVIAAALGVDADAGESLLWQDPGSDLAIRVEIVDGTVSRMHWGASGAVDLIEGCT